MSAQSVDIPSISAAEGTYHARLFHGILGHEPVGVTELRALGDRRPMVAYADSVETFVALAMERNRLGDHVYVGLQPRPLDLFEKAPDEWRPARGGVHGNVARADDIEFVTTIALDIDVDTPVRREGSPASDKELEACIEVGRGFQRMEGFVGTAAVAVSGNGAYVINPITPVEVDGDTGSKLKALEEQWIAEISPLPAGVRIDPIMDLPRFIRVIGTINYKGTPTDGRPNRRACVLLLPMIGGRQHLLAERILHMSMSPGETHPNATHAGFQSLRGDLERFQSCAFVQWIAQEAASIPEPAWMDFLVQCARLEGGDEIAHQLSERDPTRYSREETEARLDRIQRHGYRPKKCHRLSGRTGRFDCPRLRTCPATQPIELAATPDEKERRPMNISTSPGPSKMPKHVVRCGGVSATTWSNTRTVNGELREFTEVELVKNYRDANGEWKKTHRFRPEDLPAVIVAAQRTYEALKVREEWPVAQIKDDDTELPDSHAGGEGQSADTP